jgi:hypothetical protein
MYSPKRNCAVVSDLNIPRIRSTYFSAVEKADRSWAYINRSPKHECRNWERGRIVSFLGMFVLDFRYCVFVVYIVTFKSFAEYSYHTEPIWPQHMV